MSLRRRLESSDTLRRSVAALADLYLVFCRRTTRWRDVGEDALRAAVAEGPVVVVIWHSRVMMVTRAWPAGLPLSSLHDTSPIGMLSGALQRRAGMSPIGMSARDSNITRSRAVLRRVREDGVSVGLAADGPTGPAHVLKDPVLDWAQATGRPVFVHGNSVRRGIRIASWDRMLVPLPFTRGARVWRRWDGQVPRRAPAADLARARAGLTEALNAVTAEADALVGLPPGP